MTFDFEDLPNTFRVGDTYGSIGQRIVSGLPVEIVEPSTTATFTLRDPLGEDVVIFEQPVRVVDVVEHVGSGTWGPWWFTTFGRATWSGRGAFGERFGCVTGMGGVIGCRVGGGGRFGLLSRTIYPEDYFVPIKLSSVVEEALRLAS